MAARLLATGTLPGSDGLASRRGVAWPADGNTGAPNSNAPPTGNQQSGKMRMWSTNPDGSVTGRCSIGGGAWSMAVHICNRQEALTSPNASGGGGEDLRTMFCSRPWRVQTSMMSAASPGPALADANAFENTSTFGG